jgi:hypothetical protein
MLEDPLVKRAVALDALLRERSPFALVRAVELAELCLQGTRAASKRSG